MSSDGSPKIKPLAEDEEKLTDSSRHEAKRWLWKVKLLRRLAIAAALVGTAPVMLRGLQKCILLFLPHFEGWFGNLVPGRTLVLATREFLRSVLNWEFGWDEGAYFFTAAIVSAGILPLYEYFKKDQEKRIRIRDAGLVPRYEPFADCRPKDNELLEAYLSRLKKKDEKEIPEQDNRGCGGFMVPGVPVYFVISPHAGFNVSLQTVSNPASGDPFDDKSLSIEAANLGLDWLGFSQWWKETKRQQWFDRADELCIRCTNRPEVKDGICRVDVIDCRYEKYLLTESAVNLTAGTRLPDMRRLFEGERWERRELNLLDFEDARRRFSMLLSVAVLITTGDNFLVLQRRSKRVAHGLGVITTSCTGFGNWAWDHTNEPGSSSDLRNAALRELHEETAIPHGTLETLDHAFIGAAFNLLHGRDLNFYAHFKTTLDHRQVAERRNKAKSRWEVASLIFIPLSKLTEDGLSIQEPFDRLLPECARHLRGAIYALVKSGRLKHVQEGSTQRSPGNSNAT
jgi:8-oxo-dGTP pyrophosphatase MutT (NUDIX family)